MKITERERAIVWLCACSGLDYRACVAQLRAVRDPALLPQLCHRENLAAAEKYLEELDREEIFPVTLLSDDYPEALKAIPDPPLVLYGAGNRALLSKRKFCIVGARITPPWAEKLAGNVSRQVAAHFAVVTGFAEGGDSAAIAGAIESGNLICVLPCGLAECYPAAHASLKERVRGKGLLLSEYKPHETATKYAFHARNRLLAGLSEGVLVVSAAEKSGALITANRALEYGRDVFAFPHNVGAAQGAGCNALIQKGAYLAMGAEDILSCYGIESEPQEAVSLTGDEARVLAVLREGGQLHVAEIALRAGLRVFAATAVLSSLEIKNLAVKSGGNQYSAV